MEVKENVIVKLTLEFALKVIEYAERLEELKKYVLARQLLRSGTSIGANVREAQNCESKADFIHKFKIAAKETEETEYWLTLCQLSKTYPECKDLLSQIRDIQNIINKIIITSRSKMIR